MKGMRTAGNQELVVGFCRARLLNSAEQVPPVGSLGTGEYFEKYLNEFNRLMTQMSALDEEINEDDKALVLLVSLPVLYNHIVTMLLFVKNILRLDERERGGGGKKERSNSWNKLEWRNCFFYSKKCHIKRDYPQRKQENEDISDCQEKRDHADDQETFTFCGDLLVVHVRKARSRPCQETSWVMDSGISHRATSRKSHFISYTPVGQGILKMGNGGLSRVASVGDVCLRTSNENKLVLKGVRHAPNLRMNVISIGKLDEEGFKTGFGDGQWKLTKGVSIMVRKNRRSGRYLMKACVIKENVKVMKGGIGQGGRLKG
ncbi:hypothetical protein Nepgr_004203 [Nepenthes gracilis]|uniref:Retrovirus-related Pol polyprotein from transposon TNT 1-94-like beta-barrel domain-containing protein n=1 Tax=Nepenthes gracilis TaxID=150966 RepID=A0AAD3S126_NEPGR|nr:hypothetical protein Nepgr_004203 [Nepenthes gracilis]